MPDKKTSSAKCHTCGQKIPFTYGNPKELIQHMFSHEQEANQNVKPCCPNNKPCIETVDCPNKLAKCTTCGGKRQTAGKSETLYDLPEGAQGKCTICVDSTKKDSHKSDCPNKNALNDRRSSSIKSNGATSLPNCPNKASSRIDLGDFTSPVKIRIRCRSTHNKSNDKNLAQNKDKDTICPSCPKKCRETRENRRSSAPQNKIKENLNKFKCSTPTKENRRSSNLSADLIEKEYDAKRRSSSLKETNRKMSPSGNKCNDNLADKPRTSCQSEKIPRISRGSLNPTDKNKECCSGKCRSNTSSEKNRRLSNTTPTSICNKTVCFAKNGSGEPEAEKHPVMQYSPCNLIKRKGTKEMYKTTLETWTAGCGSINCPRCHRKVVPLIRKKKNKMTFSSVGASLLLTCWPFCFLIPTLHNCSVDLYCPCCKYKLGVYNSSTGKTKSVCRKENASNT